MSTAKIVRESPLHIREEVCQTYAGRIAYRLEWKWSRKQRVLNRRGETKSLLARKFDSPCVVFGGGSIKFRFTITHIVETECFGRGRAPKTGAAKHFPKWQAFLIKQMGQTIVQWLLMQILWRWERLDDVFFPRNRARDCSLLQNLNRRRTLSLLLLQGIPTYTPRRVY